MAAAEVAGRGWAKARAAILYTQALEIVPEDDAALKKELGKKQAVATVAAFHIRDVERDRGRQQPAAED
jgi:hypothetical protein